MRRVIPPSATNDFDRREAQGKIDQVVIPPLATIFLRRL
jgi:hypothetical protein